MYVEMYFPVLVIFPEQQDVFLFFWRDELVTPGY